MAFPVSPSDNDIATFNGVRYIYVASKLGWRKAPELYSINIDISAVEGSILPDTNIAYDLGSPTNRWRDLYLSGNTIYLGNAILSTDTVSGTIAISSPPTAEYPDPQAFVITASGSTTTTSTIGGVVDFETVAVELETNSGFDGAYSSLIGTPTIPTDLTDLGISDGTSGQLLTTDGAGSFTFADAPVSLPDQTGNTGKYLTTDGTDATWVDVATGLTWTSSTSVPTSEVTIGDRWYDTDTNKIYEYISDGVTSIWIETSGIDIGITTEPSGGVTTYATLPELGAAGNIAGSMGYVTTTGNFYNNDGTGWSKVVSLLGTEPDAPTIGTATPTSDTTATISYTAPTYTGGSTITSYVATSSPGSITGTLNQAGSGTIQITGLTGGTTYTFTITATNSAGTSLPSAASNSITTDNASIDYLVVGGGGGGGSDMGGGGGAGGYIASSGLTLAPGTYPITVGASGPGAPAGTSGPPGTNGNPTIALGFTALGGGGGASKHDSSSYPAGSGGSGGGGSGARQYSGSYGGSPGTGTAGQGNNGAGSGVRWYPGGGGGAGAAASQTGSEISHGGVGISNSILGSAYFWAGGGGGAGYTNFGGNGGNGGGGGGAPRGGSTGLGGTGFNSGANATVGTTVAQTNVPGGDAGANTGGGGGGGAHYNSNNKGGAGGSGIVIIRTSLVATATTGSPTITVVGGYRVYTFTSSGTITF